MLHIRTQNYRRVLKTCNDYFTKAIPDDDDENESLTLLVEKEMEKAGLLEEENKD